MKYVNYAAVLPSPGAPLEVATAPFPQAESLGPDELIIKNHAAAVNPVDWKIQADASNRFGLTFPAILGEDVAGEVVHVGAGAAAAKQHGFKRGDRVLAQATGLANGRAFGGFQLYVKVKARVAARIPDALAYAEAVVLPLSISTATAGLYLSTTLGLRLPSSSSSSSASAGGLGSSSSRETLLLWGGSSSVGSSVVQLAAASGYAVVATASPANYAYVKGLGAALVLDYHNPDVVELLVAVLRGTGRLVGAYDAIGTAATVRQTAAVVGRVGGGVVASVGAGAPADVAEGVRVVRVSSGSLDARVAAAVWGAYVPRALESGALKARPREVVVGRGLYYLQEGLDLNKKGVSAAKVVVTL